MRWLMVLALLAVMLVGCGEDVVECHSEPLLQQE